MGCATCEQTLNEVKRLEEQVDVRYLEFLKCSKEMAVGKAQDSGLIKAIHTRMDAQDIMRKDLSDGLMEHMSEEATHHESVARELAVMSKELSVLIEALKSVPSKEELAKTNGRIKTIWIIGSGAIALIGALSLYALNDLKNHFTATPPKQTIIEQEQR